MNYKEHYGCFSSILLICLTLIQTGLHSKRQFTLNDLITKGGCKP